MVLSEHAFVKDERHKRETSHTRRTTLGLFVFSVARRVCHGVYLRSVSDVYGPLQMDMENGSPNPEGLLAPGEGFMGGIFQFRSVR